MAEQQSHSTAKSDRWSYFWLAIWVILLVFANGKWIIPLAAWLAPVFIMRFLRMQKPVRGPIIAALALIMVSIIVWKGMIPLHGTLYYVIAASIGLFYLLPFLFDRFIAIRVKGFAMTLVFPLSWITLEYLNSLVNPYGSHSALAYTQHGHLPLMQVVSVTGLSGLAFLITWFASVVNWAWEQEFRWPEVRKGMGLYAGILALVLLLGGARLILFPPASKTVRVGTVSASQILRSQYRSYVNEADWEGARQASDEILEALIKSSRQAAHAGAKIVLWNEVAAIMLKDDEAASIARGRELTHQENIFLGMSLFKMTRAYPDEKGENKVIWIAPSGELMEEYLKSKPVPGEPCIAGEGKVAILETPYGRIASVICFDMDFPVLVRQAGRTSADIMLVPTLDWKEVKLMHRNMAVFRAVENGFSLVRANGGPGLSSAADYQGRILATMDQSTSDQQVLIADVPTRGVTTIYSRTGDLFAWFCVLGFLTVVGWAVVRRRAE